jgi:putative membrane protein
MMMLWIKAFHLIFVITWFAGLFYLPRLFVYHAMSQDTLSLERFKIMERKLYYGIMTPSGILATGLGIWLFCLNYAVYLTAGWMQFKLALVGSLWIYHLLCNHYRKKFKNDSNQHSHVFYRWFNEVPVLILIGVVLLVILKP